MIRRSIIFSIVLSFSLLVIACGTKGSRSSGHQNTDTDNSAPVIQSFSVYPQPVYNSATLECIASDEDNDPLNYTWRIGGVEVATGSTVLWNSLGSPGRYLLKVIVSDGLSNTVGDGSVSVASPSPWSRFKGDGQGTGLSVINTSEISNSLQWTFTAGGELHWPVLGSDGTIYDGASDGKMYAINPDGSLKWTFSIGGTQGSSPAIGADGTIYIGGTANEFFAINPDGSERWTYTGSGSEWFEGSPVIGPDGTIYTNAMSNKIHALNPDGSNKWIYNSPANIALLTLGEDGTIYSGTTENYLLALNPDGTQKWTFQTGGPILSVPAVDDDGTIYASSYDGNLYAINPDGTQKWTFAGYGDIVHSSPSIGPDGTIYIAGAFLYALTPEGKTSWEFYLGQYTYATPTVAQEGTIYIAVPDFVYYDSGTVYAVNPGGSQKWVFTMNSPHYLPLTPIIGVDGTLYIPSEEILIAIR